MLLGILWKLPPIDMIDYYLILQSYPLPPKDGRGRAKSSRLLIKV